MSDENLNAQCKDGLNLEFSIPEEGRTVIVQPRDGHGQFNAGRLLFGHVFGDNSLKADNFKRYWFKNCLLKYDGRLHSGKEIQGEETFGEPEDYQILLRDDWAGLDLGVTSPHKEYFPGHLPTGVAAYYGFPTDRQGKNQSIAVISLGGKMDLRELAWDFKKLGLDPMPDISVRDVPNAETISRHYVRTKRGPVLQDRTSTGETHLDVEVIGTICPKAKITVYRGTRTTEGFALAVQKAVEDGNSVISISWGGDEYESASSSALEAAFEKATADGVTICVATGDGGSANARDGNRAVPHRDKAAHVQYPACSPSVLACGGTEVDFVDGNKKEVVWNNSEQGGGAVGGGVSEYVEMPKWQSAHGIDIRSANDEARRGRVVPDVAGLAAYIKGADWSIYEGGVKYPNGGTSAVAPLWASLIALVNERRADAGKNPLGFINDALYALGAKGGYFKDITEGDNRVTANYPGYDATQGFDGCTGWGTPIAGELAEALFRLPDRKPADDHGSSLILDAGEGLDLEGSGPSGAIAGFGFPGYNLDKGFSTIDGATSGPDYRTLAWGWSLEADCTKCHKSVIVRKGMVSGDVTKNLFDNPCSNCRQTLGINDITGWWFFGCNARWDGRMKQPEKVVKGQKRFGDKKCHKTISDRVNYFYLDLWTTAL